jgi:hypothetical protein
MAYLNFNWIFLISGIVKRTNKSSGSMELKSSSAGFFGVNVALGSNGTEAVLAVRGELAVAIGGTGIAARLSFGLCLLAIAV